MMMMGSLCHCIVVYAYLENDTGCRTAVNGASLLLMGGPARTKSVLHGCGTSPVCSFYAIATVFQSYHGCDMIMRCTGETPSLHFY